MRTMLLALAAMAAVSAQFSHAGIVLGWNEAALDAIRTEDTSPPAAARNLAILHAAIYDAVNGVLRTHEPYLVKGKAPSGASVEAAASAAAHGVLVDLHPNESAIFDELHTRTLSTIPDGPHKHQGRMWGKRVAVQILAARAKDGASAQVPWPGSKKPGQWRPTVSFDGVVLPALLPGWGAVTPFALASGAQYRPSRPPALNTWQYAAEVNHVKRIGAADSTWRSADQTEIALFWGYGPGTATPPGHWNQIAQAVAVSEGNTLAENARMFALMNLALADAAIVSWDCKYLFNYWRPITAIQLADTDGNPLTKPDPVWMPLLPNPPFPEYTSGHSTFSAAAAVALAVFYDTDRVPFVVGSDDLPGVIRYYNGFWEAALESGVSRVYGGIHFMSGNLQGLLGGARTGAYVVHRYLRPRHDDGKPARITAAQHAPYGSMPRSP